VATTTTKLALTKPDGTDLVDIAVLNTNADKIDAASGATICTSSTRPASPWNGQVIFETDTLNALVYRTSTSSWNILGGSTVASEPPAGAGNGNFWWDSDNGKLYIYYNDGNSGQWVSVMPSQTTVDVSSNAIINGDFEINQRGFTSITASQAYTFDRWITEVSTVAGTATYSAQTFTPGTAPVAGYEAKNYARVVTSGFSGNGYALYGQKVEDVRSFAGQTVTMSFWAKAASGTPQVAVYFNQNFGTGGSTAVTTKPPVITLSTSWTRYSVTTAIPGVSGKTIGTGSFLFAYLLVSDNNVLSSGIGVQNNTFDFWGVQLEKGTVATSFKTATGTKQGELAACQRYYEKSYAQSEAPGTVTVTGQVTFYGTADGSGNIVVPVKFSTVKRTPNAYTVAVYNGSGVAGQMDWTRNGAGASGGATLYRANDAMFHAYVKVGSAWAACNGAMHWTCNAEL